MPDNPNYEGEGYLISNESWFTNYNGTFKNGDNNYQIDYNQMTKLKINNINVGYWLASRRILFNGESYQFLINQVYSAGYLNNIGSCYVKSNGTIESYDLNLYRS